MNEKVYPISRRSFKELPSGRVVTRGHFFSGPLITFNSSLAARMDPRAFWSSFQLIKAKVSQVV